ncbi:MAG TPA: GNAT family N-acetyltransferase, partial [Gaiellaceae bacterium]|nr:GNAT family N-acetyltransferase [Gaiellaceae bacterium]
IYALSTVRQVRSVPGSRRHATREDADLLIRWIRAFGAEARHHASAPGEDAGKVVAARFDGPGGFAIWENGGEPVSLVGWGARTPNGVRIGPVYTPREHRGRGYASALTAAVSAEQLAAGRRFCFLYTDAANPTANKIYRAIGYEHVCESVELAFEPA